MTSKSTFHATILRVSSQVPTGVAARIDPGPAKASATRPEVLSRAEAGTLIAARPAASGTGIRNGALITLLERDGLRISETLAVRPAHVGPERGTVRVMDGKGHKRR